MKLTKEQALQHFSQLLDKQIARNARMKEDTEFTDFSACAPLIIGVCAGDGIGPAITAEAERILRFMLAEDVAAGKVEIRTIEGLTIENRLEKGKAIPDDVLAELKACHLILKGPTTTPDAGDKKNVGSANVAMRRELDLFCNLRPVRIPELGIDWAFFRENTEGAYAMGEAGFEVDGVSLDFTVAT
ncbi:MAG: isocitrate/isopropylmalate dehydrogenase family protein, partial [Oscillospiraceae bacterium]|nr:isocitrate/isopropylmalate dehydrogenase family protein [Oscillospiraceae bacterium]